MEEKKTIQEAEYKSSYDYLRDRIQTMSAKYAQLPPVVAQEVAGFAFGLQGMAIQNNPWLQNARIKNISSLPVNYSKDMVADMIVNPYGNEQPLREVSHALEYTAYPYFKIRHTYQDLMSYHWMTYPTDIEDENFELKDALREWRLVDRFAKAMDVKGFAHKLVGQTLQEGKVFYTLRYKLDKAHNQVAYAFPQQLPSDWVKIVGLNGTSKYTVAFNMFYFLRPGADFRQFGDLFEPYIWDFSSIIDVGREPVDKNFIYASTPLKAPNGAQYRVNVKKFNDSRQSFAGNPELYQQNGRWCYWAILPIDKVWTFEIDDCDPAVVSPLTGLFLSMAQIAAYESLQYELLVNPLVSLLTGEIPYYDNVNRTAEDPIKLSVPMTQLFESRFYSMMGANNTGGIGLYAAPFQNMKLQQLSAAPNASSISGAGYANAVVKSGLSAILPTSTDARAGAAQISFQIESNFARIVYWKINRMMNHLIKSFNLKWDFEFEMFGSLATDKAQLEEARVAMTHGVLFGTLRYEAMNGHTFSEDISISNIIVASGLLSKRYPLLTSYTARASNSNLPPSYEVGGRPTVDGAPKTDGAEQDYDEDLGGV